MKLDEFFAEHPKAALAFSGSFVKKRKGKLVKL